MNSNKLLAVAASLLFLSPVWAEEHRLEMLKTPAPADDLSKEIADQLAPTGFVVFRGSSRTVCQVWFCKEWVIDPSAKTSNLVLYPFKPGQLVGVLNFVNKGKDFRNQNLDPGVYTLRYGLQPIDGAHVGTSPTRDFFLLSKASDDKSAANLGMEKLVELSCEAAESSHPAMLCLQRPKADAKAEPAIRHNEDRDWWIVSITGKAKVGDAVKGLLIERVVAGHAEE